MKFVKIQFAFVIAVLMLFGVPIFGQLTSGNIIGAVYDPTGATVPGAPIVAHNNATGVDVNTTSTSAGDFR